MSNTQTARIITGGLLFLLFLLSSGCATLQTDRVRATASAFPQPVELTEVPFFPQEDYQCGPAALATVLNVTGVTITPAPKCVKDPSPVAGCSRVGEAVPSSA